MASTVHDIMEMLDPQSTPLAGLQAHAQRVMKDKIGEWCYPRALVEISNECRKDCLYCGIRASARVHRYTMSVSQIVETVMASYEQGYASVVLQSGERVGRDNTQRVTEIVGELKERSGGKIGITLSLGEQSMDTLSRWYDAGAGRYLLRIETSDQDLYRRIHPDDGRHGFRQRLDALGNLRRCGYQVGTGVMIGLPGQTIEHLARDILFMRDADIDMCGMGPYIPALGTPLAALAASIPSPAQRVELTLRMIAALRLEMPDINIAATTALETLETGARLRALDGGANVFMPNFTPPTCRGDYSLYDNKQSAAVEFPGGERIKWGERGDPKRFEARIATASLKFGEGC